MSKPLSNFSLNDSFANTSSHWLMISGGRILAHNASSPWNPSQWPFWRKLKWYFRPKSEVQGVRADSLIFGQRSRSAKLENLRRGMTAISFRNKVWHAALMTASDPTPVISNIYWKIFAETNLNDGFQKSWSAAFDLFQPVMACSLESRLSSINRSLTSELTGPC